MVESSNIYTLLVKENDELGRYHCVLEFAYPSIQEGKVFNWFLLKDSKLLSSGICSEEDIETMLKALKTDLNGYSDWVTENIH